MKSASELLETYLNNVGTPKVSAAQFAEDGVLELPTSDAIRSYPVRDLRCSTTRPTRPGSRSDRARTKFARAASRSAPPSLGQPKTQRAFSPRRVNQGSAQRNPKNMPHDQRAMDRGIKDRQIALD